MDVPGRPAAPLHARVRSPRRRGRRRTVRARRVHRSTWSAPHRLTLDGAPRTRAPCVWNRRSRRPRAQRGWSPVSPARSPGSDTTGCSTRVSALPVGARRSAFAEGATPVDPVTGARHLCTGAWCHLTRYGRHVVSSRCRRPEQPSSPGRAVIPDVQSDHAVGIGAVMVAGTVAATAAAVPSDDRYAGDCDRRRPVGSARAVGPRSAAARCCPADNPWNTSVAAAPIHPRSGEIVSTILANGGDFLHPDFGENPRRTASPTSSCRRPSRSCPITYDAYGDESDPGPFPIPLTAPIEGGTGATGDRHVIAVQRGTCELYELFGGTDIGRPVGRRVGRPVRPALERAAPDWAGRAADAAGLPIFPGLVRYDEVPPVQIRPRAPLHGDAARSAATSCRRRTARRRSTDPNLPADGPAVAAEGQLTTCRGCTGQARVDRSSRMQKYGMIVADNGSNWFISGCTEPGWNDDDLNQLKIVPGSAFEVVDTGPVLTPDRPGLCQARVHAPRRPVPVTVPGTSARSGSLGAGGS